MKKSIRYIFDKDFREKMRLIQQMRSKDNLETISAVNTLRENREQARRNSKDVFTSISVRSWTNLENEDFSGANMNGVDMSDVGFNLKKANLSHATLRGARLIDTILDEAFLDYADLSDADMTEINLLGASLKRAILNKANLQEAHLHRADFRFASFIGADLYGAKMHEANFQGADFNNSVIIHANFKNANLKNAIFHNISWNQEKYGKIKNNVILPDESIMEKISDLDRFTNPNHQNFWRPKTPVIWSDENGVLKKNDISSLDIRRNDDY